MFVIERFTISITRGDTGIFTLNLMNGRQAYDYSNDTVVLTVKKDTQTTEHLIQKAITYGENVVIAPADTANLPYGEYVYDVQVTTAGGLVDTVIPPSKFIVMPEVTFGE